MRMREKGISSFGMGCHWTICMLESLFILLASVCSLLLPCFLFSFGLELMIEGECWGMVFCTIIRTCCRTGVVTLWLI